jgi:3-methyladenine DNA glycosylase AlkD
MINIKKELLDLSEVKIAEMNAQVNPHTKYKMLGIRIPILRKKAKELVKEYELKELLDNIEEEYYDEVLLKGLIIGYSKIDVEDKLKAIKYYLPKIDSWGLTDSFIPTLKIKENELKKYWEFILPYTKSKKEFDVRFSIIMMLDYYLIDNYIDKVIEMLDDIKHDGYYVKMAIAWTLCEIGIKYNDKFMKYINSCNLDKFTYNKTLQKLIESYRISDKQKELFRKMKRK